MSSSLHPTLGLFKRFISNFLSFHFSLLAFIDSQLEHALLSQFLWPLYVINSMLCKAQHVLQISSHISILFVLTLCLKHRSDPSQFQKYIQHLSLLIQAILKIECAHVQRHAVLVAC